MQQKEEPKPAKYINTRFKIFTVKLLCGSDPKNITLYLYLLSAGAKKQPLSFSATLIFHQRDIFMCCRKINSYLNNIATHVDSQNNANNNVKLKEEKKTDTGNTTRKGVFHHASTKWRPRENPVWLNTINSENPDQSCSTRGTIRHYYCLASQSVWVYNAGQHLSSPAASKLSFQTPAPATWPPPSTSLPL